MSLIFSFVKLGSDVMPADLQEANKESKVSQSFPNHSKALEVPETVLDDAWTTGGTLGWGSAGQGWGQLLTQVAFELSVFLLGCRYPPSHPAYWYVLWSTLGKNDMHSKPLISQIMLLKVR